MDLYSKESYDEILIYNMGLRRWIHRALEEDMGRGDITSAYVVPKTKQIVAKLVSGDEGVLSGLTVYRMVYDELGVALKWNIYRRDGSRLEKGDIICEFTGSALGVLVGERVSLNIVQQMSGISTYTDRLAQKIAHTKARVVDTRKTVPFMRMLSKYAVRVGGGVNHRFGLDDAVLIKDNHIAAAGGIEQAVSRVKKYAPYTAKIEVETSCPSEVKEALNCGVDIIMLDNMDADMMKKMVELIDGRVLVEASGDINEYNILEAAESGVDFISVGALTHSHKALNIRLKIE